MSSKNVTTSTNQYDPNSLATYRNLQGPATTQLGQQITNPNSNPLMNRLRQQGSIASAGLNRGPGVPTSGSNGAAFSRGVSSFGAQTNNNLLIGGAQMRNQAIGASMNYRPLQTGGKQVQSTSGLGTWLPSVIGAGLSTFGIKTPLKNNSGDPVGSQYSGPSMPGYGGSDFPSEYSGGDSSSGGVGGSNDYGNDSVWGLTD